MAAPTTIHDLPDDMLHEIFGRVYAAESEETNLLPVIKALQSPKGAHLALRSVCRHWRDIADWVRLSTSTMYVDTWLAGNRANQPRHPAAIKTLALESPISWHSTSLSRVAAGLLNSSADLRRALVDLTLSACCLPALVPAVTPVASCTALTQLCLIYSAHRNERAVPSNVLAPLSALRALETLAYANPPEAEVLPASARMAPLPALPDAPRLTRFCLSTMGNFVPVGSDAALGRLRKLVFRHLAPARVLLDAEDPFLLRVALDAGTWQPSRLTGLQELDLSFDTARPSGAPLLPPPATGPRSGSEWAPLAGQVTALNVRIEGGRYGRPSTGIVAGLGVLTALRELRVIGAHPTDLEPVSGFDRVHAPDLTYLWLNCVTTPVDAAQFPDLVHLDLSTSSFSRQTSTYLQPPLNLRSLVARSSLKFLALMSLNVMYPTLLNLAELFVGGAGWPVLEYLALRGMVLEWDATGLAGAPTAAEFGQSARQLLPALVKVKIDEHSGRGVRDYRSRAGFVGACRRHVLPALKGLHAGRRN